MQSQIILLLYQCPSPDTRRISVYWYCFLYVLTECAQQCFVYERCWGSKVSSRKKRESKTSRTRYVHQSSRKVVENDISRVMFTLLDANQKDSLVSIWYDMLWKKIARAKTFTKPETKPKPFNQPHCPVKFDWLPGYGVERLPSTNTMTS